MKFTLPSLLLAVAAAFVPAACIGIPSVEKRVSCAEAARFGILQIGPSTVAPGNYFTVHADFTCSLYFGITPIYIDYYIEVGSGGTGHLGPVLLGRRKFHQSFNTPPTDTFSVQLPYAYWESNATYIVTLDTTYAVNGTASNSTYNTVGGTETAIFITGYSSS
ncbi:hypothetical protein F5887DRAFT_979608 [Amanita rubescens]|nr:hypothetical protein F5887DRAFT_979608 [Amanita rubescens]